MTVETYKGYLIDRFYDNNVEHYSVIRDVENPTEEDFYYVKFFGPNYSRDKELENRRIDYVKQHIDEYINSNLEKEM